MNTDSRIDSFCRTAFLRLRPGAVRNNVRILLSCVRQAARTGCKVLSLPEPAIQGGSCGALSDHPAVRDAVDTGRRAFENGVKRLKKAPKIVWTETDGRWMLPVIAQAGPDPRLPFCGSPAAVFERQVYGFARRLAAIGMPGAVIGLSGGLDSALALLVTVAAFDLLQMDRARIVVLTMPGFGTTKRTRGNAELLAEGLGLTLETVDITAACRQHLKDIGHPPDLFDVTFENAQARERTQILMDKANQTGGIVVGTGDLSEIALGWSTYNGDHMSMFAVNAGVPKTAVREVCSWWAEQHPGKAAEALLDILATPVSPELVPAKRGQITQKTEEKIGPYELHDFFLWHFIAEGKTRAEMRAAARAAFRGRYPASVIDAWLTVFFNRLFSQSFKRNCAPDAVPVYRVFFSPETWRIPSDMAGADLF